MDDSYLVRDKKYKNEADNDYAKRFIAERYVSDGYRLHFHTNLEIYGVIKGEVYVTVAGESKVLTDGQMAVINCMESHSYAVKKSAEIFYFQMGTDYLKIFLTLYRKCRLPHFLTDAEYNKKLFAAIEPLFGVEEPVPELKRFGISCQILSDIIDGYGVLEGDYDNKGNELIEQVVQYIYTHYYEDITLTSLGEKFCMAPKLLSKKISKYIGVDLRVFVNNVRAQKAIQMMYEPENKGKPIKEISALCGFSCVETFYRVYERNNKFFID